VNSSEYQEKLKDPRWDVVRLKVLDRASRRCQICGTKNRELHAHHSYYVRGRDPWEYPLCSLICACDICHHRIHAKLIPRDVTMLLDETIAELLFELGNEAHRRNEARAPVVSAKDRFAQMKAMLNAHLDQAAIPPSK